MAGFADTYGNCDKPVEATLRSRGALVIESKPAGIEIVGTEEDVVRVTCTVDHGADPHDFELRLSGTAGFERLTVSGGGAIHNENLEIRIEVPRKTNLKVHMDAGQVKIEAIAGDKDVDLYAGQIVIASPDVSNYRSVDASVTIGEVKASAWGVEKGGFFRSFTRTTGDGEYRLRAHVLTGQIDLE
jgi:hypothetical protein